MAKFNLNDVKLLVRIVDHQGHGQDPCYLRHGEGAAGERLRKGGYIVRGEGKFEPYLPTPKGLQMAHFFAVTLNAMTGDGV